MTMQTSNWVPATEIMFWFLQKNTILGELQNIASGFISSMVEILILLNCDHGFHYLIFRL